MAFLLPIVEGIEGIAAFAGAGVAENTGSVIAGKVVEGQVSGALVGGLIGGVQNVLETGADYIFGKEPVDNFKNHAYETYQTVQTFAPSLIGREADSYSDQEVIKMIKDKGHQHEDILKLTNNFVKDFSKQSIGQDVPNVLDKLKKVNPIYYYLASKFLDFNNDFIIPNDDDYAKISSIYTGDVLFNNDIKELEYEGNTQFYITLEDSKEYYWVYPEYNTYTVIPALYDPDGWVGINSPNFKIVYGLDKDSVKKQVNIEKIAFIHDTMYHDYGTFNKFADYVLISYIESGLKRGVFTFNNEEKMAQIALKYFSTLGRVVRSVYGDDTSKGVIESLYKDVYDVSLDYTHLDTIKIHSYNEIKNNPPVLLELIDEPVKPVSKVYRPETIELVNLIESLAFE